MEPKENIKNRILESAHVSAEKILSGARAEIETARREARADIDVQEAETLKKAETRAAEIKSHRETASRLESRKAELLARQQLVDGVYSSVLSDLKAMRDSDYLAFIERLIKKYGEDGDEVIISATEKNRLTADWLNGAIKRLNIKLTLSKETHSEEGGIVLRNSRFDKRLTYSAILKGAREKTENEVIRRLF
jgi:V/A-type H+-transporting ATPase subunit E